MQRFKFLLLIVVFWGLYAEAAEFDGIGAEGEVAFDYNFLSSKGIPIPYTEGATNETYRLNDAVLRLKKNAEQILLIARLNYTPRQYSPDGVKTATANFSTLSQLEVFYKVTPKLHLGFGRLVTTMGYDSVLRYENTFYNNSIAYQRIVPGSGEGLRANYISDSFTASASTYNQFNFGATGEDYAATKATELSIMMKFADFTGFAGYLTGKDASEAPATGTTQKSSSDFWVSYKPTSNLLLVLTYDAQTYQVEGASTHWFDATSAMAVYTYGINNFGVRYEMVRGANDIGYAAADHVNVLYLTDKIKLTDHLNLYVEGRFDHADEDVYFNKDGVATDNATMITLAALAYF
ncbi:outer membrane beta-barrel protein [Bdellovibrio sp. HCB337]|uniref:outer membrane beta-barrel protein n=1 Tax=Bdellovibrio sp. HCB337 TaxID=3394358 RepID=UPI0039A64680